MTKSMTAYGRAVGNTSLGKVVVEIHSVNRKALDININLPKEWIRFDIDIRKLIGKAIERGQVTVRIFAEAADQEILTGAMEKSLKALKKKWDFLAKKLDFDPEETVTLSFLLQQVPTAGDILDEKKFKTALEKTVDEALEELLTMKKREGKALQQDLLKHLQNIEQGVEEIASRSEESASHYREKLKKRIGEVCGMSAAGDDRIVREVAVYAEKVDITEEIVRLRSHFSQFRAFLKSDEKSTGRSLEFLVQEMLREMGTMSAKTAETAVSLLAVSLRSLLEKIREQVQNIE
jgi:uncharacterized protein (TIGR00255 family)